MVGIPQVCTRCGKISISSLVQVEPGGSVQIENVSSQCPYCGGEAMLRDGTYTAVRSVIEAIRSPEVTRAELERLRSIAQSVSKGSTGVEHATAQANELSAPLAHLWAAIGTSQAQFLAALLAIILMIYFHHAADEQAAKQRILAERQVQIEQTILEELQKLRPPAPAPQTKVAPKQRKQQPDLAQTRSPNRHARRRQAALKRKGRSGES